MEIWDIYKALQVSVGGVATEMYLATGTYTGVFQTMMVVDTPTKIEAYTDDGANPCVIPT